MNIAFVFPGQGSQFVGMGRELYENFTVAKEVFEEVDDSLSLKLSKIILDGSDEDLTKTENTQPALMCASIAACRVVEHMTKVKIPEIAKLAAGHSLGQYTALCAFGSIKLRDCAKILSLRGKYMKEVSIGKRGAMAAIIDAKFEIVDEAIKAASNFGVCQIANDNSVNQLVISGDEEAIDFAIAILKDNGVKAIKLKVSAAFHSKLMEPAMEKMRDVLDTVEIKSPEVEIIDNVSLSLSKDPNFIKEKLLEQIPGKVRWRETMEIIAGGAEVVYEVGPGKVLANLFKKSYPHLTVGGLFSITEIENFCKISNT